MKAKRHTEITLETHETTVISFGQKQTIIFCKSCQVDTQHLSLVQALQVLAISEPVISSLVDDKQIHSRQMPDGSLLLCSDSLAARVMDQTIP